MRKGFTLLELLIVVIIIGVLAAIGLPRFLRVQDRARTSEIVTVLDAARGAQMRYAASHNNLTSDVCGDLDVDFTTLKYTTWPANGHCTEVNVATGSDNAEIVTVDTNNITGLTDLAVQLDGDICCVTACPTIGYPPCN